MEYKKCKVVNALVLRLLTFYWIGTLCSCVGVNTIMFPLSAKTGSIIHSFSISKLFILVKVAVDPDCIRILETDFTQTSDTTHTQRCSPQH